MTDRLVNLMSIGFLVQALSTPAFAPDFIGQIEKLTLTAALVIAVGVLWKTLSKKDVIVLECNTKMIEALIQVTDSNRELRKIIESQLDVNRGLAESIESLRDVELGKYDIGREPKR